MKRLNDVETDQYVLEVVECDCGYHMGFDSSYIDQVAWITAECPSCHAIIETSEILKEK